MISWLGGIPRSAARGIRAFQEEYGERVLGGLLLHGGSEVFWLSKGILALPWWKVV